MQEGMDCLGWKCIDVITNFEGIAECIQYDLYGCIGVILRPPMAKDKTLPESRWFDLKRIKKISKPNMDVPKFKDSKPLGPANHAIARKG